MNDEISRVDSANRTVSFVVDQRLCTGCGTCVPACPSKALSMEETSAGFCRPRIDEQRCVGCGMCYRACSGVHHHFPLPEHLDELFLPRPRRVFLGRACDPEIHSRGQSGGVATALLNFLLERKSVSHALVTSMPANGSLRPQPVFATSREQLLECVGSKYCMNPLNAALAGLPEGLDGLAVVGLPCHIHGIRNLQQLVPRRWDGVFRCLIGLFCLQVGGYLCMDNFLRLRNVSKPVSRVVFRKKIIAGEPGEPCIEYADGTCQILKEDFVGLFSAFAPLRCGFCFDQMNQMSDLALGDPNGFPDEITSKGLNTIAVYTPVGEKILESAEQQGAVKLFDCSREQIWQGQLVIQARKPRVISHWSRWKELHRPVPDVGALENLRPIPQSRFSRMNMEFMWRFEGVSDRSKAYRSLMRRIWLRKRWGKVRRYLGRRG